MKGSGSVVFVALGTTVTVGGAVGTAVTVGAGAASYGASLVARGLGFDVAVGATVALVVGCAVGDAVGSTLVVVALTTGAALPATAALAVAPSR
jgi:hypothetical protein